MPTQPEAVQKLLSQHRQEQLRHSIPETYLRAMSARILSIEARYKHMGITALNSAVAREELASLRRTIEPSSTDLFLPRSTTISSSVIFIEIGRANAETRACRTLSLLPVAKHWIDYGPTTWDVENSWTQKQAEILENQALQLQEITHP